jgi:phosphoglycolate phosphatase
MADAKRGKPAPRTLDVGGVLFDLDGTLADTAGDLVASLNRIRTTRGLSAMSTESLRPYASEGARGLLRAGMGIAADHADFRALRDEFLAHYAEGLAATTQLFDGMASLLEQLDQRALRWGIVTNKLGRFTTPVVVALGIEHRAGAIVSGDTTPHAKPHPAPLFHAADALGISPERCVYVGDDLRDIQAGNAAGMPTIVAEYGYLGVGADPDTWPATGWIAHPLELLDWLPETPAA